MAATQAEHHQHKEVIREQAQQPEQPQDVAGPGLQNGTEKNGGRDNVSGKAKLPVGHKSSLIPGLEMSQYRQESGAGPPGNVNSDQGGNSGDVDSAKINSDGSGKPFPPNSDPPGGDPSYGKLPDNAAAAAPGYGGAGAGYPGSRGGYPHLDQHPGSNNSDLHHPYAPPGMRHHFPGKPQAAGPMIPPRPPSGGANSNSPGTPFSPHGQQQRFLSGQSISQPTGPTPTLNQLLQASNPVHRYPNSYGDMNMQKPGEQGPAGYGYNQWPSSYPGQHLPPGYRNQSPYGAQQPYPDQRSSWGGPAPPPGHPAGLPPGHPPPGHPPGHPPPGHPAGNPPGHPPPGHLAGHPPPGHPPPPQPGHPPPGHPPPHPPSPAPPPSSPGHHAGGHPGQHPSQSPSPHPQPSPQPPSPSPQQHQSFSSRPPGEPAPSAHAPDAAVSNRVGSPRESTTPKPSDLTGQNSNDSSSGPQGAQGPGTPNSMRPTPSPTGSSGSRSMSPAVGVGQQNIPMPPRPSSVQSDSSGPTRMSLSPMAAQGGYQQPLAPPPHLHAAYKMGGPHAGMPPSAQQMPPYSPQQAQQYPQGGSYSPRPQGNMQYNPNQNYGPGAGGQQGGAYPSRPIPNHVPHSQFGYQGWGGPGMNQGPPPNMMGGPGNHVAGKSPNGPPSGPPGPQGGGPPSGAPSATSPQTPPPQGAPGPPGPPGQPGPPGPAPSPGMSPGPRPHTPPHGGPGPHGPPGPHGGPHGPPHHGGPHYLKQHLQHKMGFGSPSPGSPGGPPSGPQGGPSAGPSPPQGPGGPPQGPPYGAPGGPGGPGGASGGQQGPPGGPQVSQGPHHGGPMGPPPGHHHPMGPMGPMGPPMGSSSPGPGGPPPGAPPGAPLGPGAPSPVPNSHGPHPHHDGPGGPHGPHGPMPPPASTPNSHASMHPMSSHSDGEMVHDNGIITTAAGTATTNVSPATTGAGPGAGPGSVTSVVTTGPDGALMDEASQQSTLSNASAASGEDPGSSGGPTPKPRPVYHNHPGGPGSAPNAPSPGPSAMNSMHEDYEMGGPGGPGGPGAGPNNWPRTPASPVFNSHVGADPYKSKKPDSLTKLYEMDDSRDRCLWLDKLLQFNEERGTPIQACPHISKNPLDLYRLYFYVKERGGFMEVCKVTKNKTWKDIAGLLGIGASSSAAYTLRKHYTKNLLPYECHFDRGGMDPQPLINQVEAGTKKKPAKAAPVPSPGSSNSQDSFPAPGSGSASMDGYSYGYPPNSGQDYNAQRPPSQTNATTPHPGYQGQGYQYPEQYGRGPEYNQQYPPGSNFPGNRSMYPPYGPEGDRPPYNQTPSGAQSGPPGTPGSDPYRYQPPGYQPRPGYPQAPPSSPGTPQPPGQGGDYYRPDRRHPDFSQPRPPMYAGWPNNSQYRGQYPPQGGAQPNSQQWSQSPRPGAPPNSQASSGPWPQSPYQPPHQPPQNSQQPWGPNMPPSGVGQSSPLRPPLGPHAQYRPDGKPRPQIPGVTPGVKMPQPSQSPLQVAMGRLKADSAFPLDSVEATTPILYKRRRLTRADVCPVEAWRLMMSLRSGLLAESCWALDTLNILLFDDVSVAYFGLQHMPGLLDVLLEHFRKALDDMFESAGQTTRKWYGKTPPLKEEEEIDLGSVVEPINPNDKTQILSSKMPNYTLVTRKGKPVKIVNRDSDVFILDSKKTWDVEGEASDAMAESDATVEALATKYIVPCFQGEFNIVPFARLIPDKKSTGQDRPNSPKTEPQNSVSVDCAPACKEEVVQLSTPEGCVSENSSEKKNCEKKKRTKSLSDVLNRIKKEKEEEMLSATKDALSRDLSSSVNEDGDVQVKKEDLGVVGKANSNRSENSNALSKDSKMVIEENHISDSSKPDEAAGKSENKSDKSVTVTEVKVEPMEVDDEVTKTTEATAEGASKTTASEKEPVAEATAPAEELVERPYLRIQDPETVVKRRRMSDYEDECYTRDEASLYLVTDTQDAVARRCVCLSNILRNLSFIPGNEMEFAKNPTFLGLLGKLMLIHHEHPLRTQRNYEREEDADCTDSCSSLAGDAEWWWDFLFQLRENVLVTMANIAGQVDLGQYPEEVSRPLLDGLLHWAVCPAAHGQDPFPTVGPNSSLSPQRLALEALCKLCVMEANVDLVIATPPYSRLERLCAVLTKLLCRSEEQVLREFAVNLLHYLAAADTGMARTVAMQGACVSQLVAFIEQAEQSALGVANTHGITALRDNPDAMGTSLDMLRRAAGTLLHLARHPDNRPLFLQQEQRLLALVMSQILDQQVAAVVSSVLFQCSRTPAPARPPPAAPAPTLAPAAASASS